MKATARPPTAEERDRRPLDVATMRAAARQLLASDAEPPTPEGLETLTLQLRGHIMLAVPDVETAALARDEDDVPRALGGTTPTEGGNRTS